MHLEGSCHCGAVRFSVEAPHPYPFNLCYCSICRKTAGAGGFAINLGAEAATLKVEGAEHIRSYHARDARRGRRLEPGRAQVLRRVRLRRSGSGTRAGPTTCTRTPRRSTRPCRCRPSAPT